MKATEYLLRVAACRCEWENLGVWQRMSQNLTQNALEPHGHGSTGTVWPMAWESGGTRARPPALRSRKEQPNLALSHKWVIKTAFQ